MPNNNNNYEFIKNQINGIFGEQKQRNISDEIIETIKKEIEFLEKIKDSTILTPYKHHIIINYIKIIDSNKPKLIHEIKHITEENDNELFLKLRQYVLEKETFFLENQTSLVHENTIFIHIYADNMEQHHQE